MTFPAARESAKVLQPSSTVADRTTNKDVVKMITTRLPAVIVNQTRASVRRQEKSEDPDHFNEKGRTDRELAADGSILEPAAL